MLAAGHELRVVYVAERFGQDFLDTDIAAQCETVQKVPFAGILPTLGRWLTGMSVSRAWCGSMTAKSAIGTLSADADVVWVEHLRGAGMLPNAINCPIIWDAVDALGPLFTGRAELVNNSAKAMMFCCEAQRTQREEAEFVLRAHATIAVTQREAVRIGANVSVVPNGVDFDYFQPAEATPDAETSPEICMVGRWNYLPNAHGCAHFLRDVWPAITKSFPGAICTIVGPGSEAGSLVADAAAPAIRTGSVVLTGPVSDIRPYIQKSLLTVCPVMLAAGMQNKILESIACGVPVVCTKVAAEGTLSRPISGLFSSGTPAQMIADIQSLLSDPTKARNAGAEGRAQLSESMSWQPSYRKIALLLEQVLQH